MSFLESLDLERFDPKRRAVRHFYSRIKSLQACRKSTQEGALESLDRVLSQHRMVGASDPLDHVYGMMGLASKHARPPNLTPDYTADPRDVFLQTAEWAVREGGLDILGLCGDPLNPNRPQGLPSWVPDFSDATGPHSLTGMGMLAPNEVSPLTRFRASKGLPTTAVVRKDSVMEARGHSIGKIEDMTSCAEPGKDTLEHLKKHTSSQVEYSRLHRREINREGLRMLNTKMAWGSMARKLTAKSKSHYAYANESMNVAFMRTFLLGETGESLERLRPFYKNDQFELKIWRLLTLGQGCSSLVKGYFIVRAMIFGLLRAKWLLRWCGYDPYFSASGNYYTRRQLSAERELFCDTKGLIGLAPRWALPGDEIFLLEGGKVPMILRRTGGDGCYQFIGEAYVHGAMHGKMFDPDKCEKLLIH